LDKQAVCLLADSCCAGLWLKWISGPTGGSLSQFNPSPAATRNPCAKRSPVSLYA